MTRPPALRSRSPALRAGARKTGNHLGITHCIGARDLLRVGSEALLCRAWGVEHGEIRICEGRAAAQLCTYQAISEYSAGPRGTKRPACECIPLTALLINFTCFMRGVVCTLFHFPIFFHSLRSLRIYLSSGSETHNNILWASTHY